DRQPVLPKLAGCRTARLQAASRARSRAHPSLGTPRTTDGLHSGAGETPKSSAVRIRVCAMFCSILLLVLAGLAREHFERCQRPQRRLDPLTRPRKPRLIDKRHARLLPAPIRVVAEQEVMCVTFPYK